MNVAKERATYAAGIDGDQFIRSLRNDQRRRKKGTLQLTIRLWWAKFLYVIAAVGILYLARSALVPDSAVPASIVDFLLMVVLLAVVYGGTRLFRGKHESPPRPLWKATGGSTSSFVVAGLWVISLLNDLRILGFRGSENEKVAALLFDLLGNAVLIVFYLYSGIRQRREREHETEHQASDPSERADGERKGANE